MPSLHFSNGMHAMLLRFASCIPVLILKNQRHNFSQINNFSQIIKFGVSNGSGHMTKMAAMAVYGKNIKKNLLLRNQKANDLESLYASSGA